MDHFCEWETGIDRSDDYNNLPDVEIGERAEIDWPVCAKEIHKHDGFEIVYQRLSLAIINFASNLSSDCEWRSFSVGGH